jgi:hypothetical protein
MADYLIIHSRVSGIYALKEKCVNDTVRANCKLIMFYLS